MRTIIVTGSAGLIGSETVKRFAKDGGRVVGIDNDMRSRFFGAEASTKKTRDRSASRTFAITSITISTFATPDRASRIVQAARARNRRRRAHGRAAFPRLGGARSANRFLGQRQRHAEPARSGARISARKRPLFSHRRTKSTATRRIVCR